MIIIITIIKIITIIIIITTIIIKIIIIAITTTISYWFILHFLTFNDQKRIAILNYTRYAQKLNVTITK